MLSLARPTRWSDIVGQDSVVNDLQKRLQDPQTFPQAILLHGPTGTGKTSCATLIARTIVCEKPVDGNPCNDCSVCQRTLNEEWGTSDIVMVDSAKILQKADLVELDDMVAYAPHFAPRKVILIEEVQELAARFQNTFLKILEAKMDHVVFIFTTMDAKKIGKPIHSRCQTYGFKIPSHQAVAEFLFTKLPPELKNNVEFVQDTIFVLAEAGENSYRKALQVLDRAISSEILTSEQAKEQFGVVTEDSIQQSLRSVLEGSASHIPLIRKEGSGFFFKSMHFLFRVKQAQLTQDTIGDTSTALPFFANHPNLNKLFSVFRTVLERGYSDDVFIFALYELVTQIKQEKALPAGVRPPTRPTNMRG